MNFLIPILMSTIAGMSTLIGSLFIFIKKKNDNILVFLLSFSSAIMLLISITDLIPESFINLINFNYKISYLILIFIIGIIFTKLIIKITKNNINTNSLYRLGILNMIVLIVHNLPEGIITFLSSMQDISLGLKLTIAILLHNIPEGISISVPIYYATNNLKKALFASFISGLAEPIGALIAFIFLKDYLSPVLIGIILIIVASIMITISIDEVYDEVLKYKNIKYTILGFIVGVLIIFLNHIVS